MAVLGDTCRKPECQLLNQGMDVLAAKFKAVKFVKIVGSQCIPNFPDKNCPTLLIYRNVRAAWRERVCACALPALCRVLLLFSCVMVLTFSLSAAFV